MNSSHKLMIKRMGVMNITPNSFSDGGELHSDQLILQKILNYNKFDAIDLGAESTAPMNSNISFEEEWSRLSRVLPFLNNISTTISLDTYHPESVFKFLTYWKGPFIWNDVSGKYDQDVKKFLNMNSHYQYIFCHNLAKKREETIKHMEYTSAKVADEFLIELVDYFKDKIHPQVIFDPCLGFSKTYEQNWYILDQFEKLQNLVNHKNWLIGFSRKSFLRKKYQLTINDREKLDEFHVQECQKIFSKITGPLWVRTHRPELL